jgi:hypothetical protein
LLVSALAALAACGVKGDPLPPEKPVELGRGRPTYKRATEGLKIEATKPKADDKDNDKDEDEDDER